jgi:hypothetical protein
MQKQPSWLRLLMYRSRLLSKYFLGIIYHQMIILDIFLQVFPEDINIRLTDNKYKRIHLRMDSFFH